MISVATVVVFRMDAINDEVDEIVNHHNVIVAHIMTMYTSARERSVSMLKMVMMEDSFDRETEFEHFNELATKFAVARMALVEMPMKEEERALLDEHARLVAITIPHQMSVIDLLAQDKFDQAEQLLIIHAIPAQNNVLHKLIEIRDYHTQAAESALGNTRLLYEEAVRYIVMLAIFAIILCVSIAWYVIRTLRQREIELKIYNDKLEDRVHERTVELESAYQELKNSQAQLVHAEKMASLGQLTAGIAHEIKNPLNFINNFSETSRELIEDLTASLSDFRSAIPENDYKHVDDIFNDLKSDLGKIENHGRRADGIVRSMLMHARKGGGQRDLISVNGLVEESLNLAYHSERAKNRSFNVKLVTELADNTGEAYIEPQEISRVLLNLFSNSFHATEQKRNQLLHSDYAPELIVETRRDNGKIWIEIADNGIGMSASTMDKIFNPFFTTKPTGEGTGLGLSLSFDIIKQSYNGDFEVESREGYGTKFLISLPTNDTS